MKRLAIVLILAVALCGCKESHKRYDERGVPYIRVQKGAYIPCLGMTTFNLYGDFTLLAVTEALKCGYRHIDTAHIYQNEANIGEAIRQSGIPREEIWVTSKLWPQEYGEGTTMRAIDRMLERFGLEYLDLLVLHHPIGEYRDAWSDMEKAFREGKVKALGIYRFDKSEEAYRVITEEVKIKPSVHQIECHPYAQRRDIVARDAKNGILTECWYPTGPRDSEILADSTIVAIAQKHGKTPAQVVLKWHLDNNRSVIPSINNPTEMDTFIDIFDFKLSEEDHAAIDALDRNATVENTSLEELEYMVVRFPLIDI
jgi:diketogulonate reductase-like aldo/keto reductase